MKTVWIPAIIMGLVAIGGVAFLAVDSAGDVQYYAHVEEVSAQPAKWLSRKTIQVHGFARNVPVKGTIQNQVIHRDFQLESKGAIIEIRHDGVVPDTFHDQSETVVKGHLTQEGDKLVLTTIGGEQGIMAKCPSKYNGTR